MAGDINYPERGAFVKIADENHLRGTKVASPICLIRASIPTFLPSFISYFICAGKIKRLAP